MNSFTDLPRRKPVRKKRSKPRHGPWRSVEYRRFLRDMWCIIAAASVRIGNGRACWGESDPAHTQNNGLSSKGPDSSCVPLCRQHHREYDAGREAFEKKYGVDMKALAAEYYAKWLSETGTEA